MTDNAEIHSAIGELRKTIESRLDDCITREKAEKIAEDVVKKLCPPERKAIVPATPEEVLAAAASFKASGRNAPESPWTSEYGRKFGNMRNFLHAAKERHPMLTDVKTIMVEGTPAVGGYLVPTEFSANVIRLMQDSSIIMRIANVLPMSTWKRQIPRQLTSVVAGWVSEGATKAKTNPTFGPLDQVAKVMAAVIKCSDELLRDSAINLTEFLSELVSEAMGLEIERVALVGDVSGVGDPFNGVLHASGAHVITQAEEKVSFDDIADLLFSLSQSYAQNGIIVLSRTGLKHLLKVRDNQGNYVYQPPAGDIPATIWQTPFEISSQIPDDLGDDEDETLALFGNFKKYLLVSPREGLAVKVSQDASDSDDSSNAFLQDQTWLRFTQALSIDVAVPAAFSYLQFNGPKS